MKVIELLSKKEKWAKKTFAKDKKRRSVPSKSQEACSWCLYGALLKCYRRTINFNKAELKLNTALRELYPQYHSLIHFNDSRKTQFKDIRKLLRKAGV